jgi:ParB family transcriptional regulator, chromosome partitioning protein
MSIAPIATPNAATSALREAATTYKVDTDAIALKVKQEFAVKEKLKKESKPTSCVTAKNRYAE